MLKCCSSSCASNRSLGAKREEADDAPGLLHLHLSVLCVFGVLVSLRVCTGGWSNTQSRAEMRMRIVQRQKTVICCCCCSLCTVLWWCSRWSWQTATTLREVQWKDNRTRWSMLRDVALHSNRVMLLLLLLLVVFSSFHYASPRRPVAVNCRDVCSV